MSDYRVKVKIINNRIAELMEENNITSVMQLAKIIGANNVDIGEIINMKVSPIKGTGRNGSYWRKCVLLMAKLFNVEPEDMFNQQQIEKPLKYNTSEVKMSSNQLAYFLEQQSIRELPEPDKLVESEDLKKHIGAVLNTLTKREKDILTSLFGIDGEDPMNLRQVGVAYNICGERVKQIREKAFRKIRYHDSSEKLLECI